MLLAATEANVNHIVFDIIIIYVYTVSYVTEKIPWNKVCNNSCCQTVSNLLTRC